MPRRTRSRPPRRTAAETLLRILDLEKQKGFKDLAVTGGLDLFLEAHADELQAVDMPENGYAALGPKERAAWANQARGAAHAGVPPTVPDVRPASADRAAPAVPVTPTARKKSAPKRKSRKPKSPDPEPVARPNLDTPVDRLSFITKSSRAKFKRLEIATLRDLLFHFPHRHVDYSDVARVVDLEYGVDTTVIVKVLSATTASIGRRGAARVRATDGTGLVDITWFGQPYLAARLKPGARLAISGTVGEFQGRAQFQNPEYEEIRGDPLTHAGVLLPVYPSTEGMYQRTLRTAARNALDAGLPLLDEILDHGLRARLALPGRRDAVAWMHHPDSREQQEEARRRLAFDELLLNQLAVQRRKREWRERAGGVRVGPDHGVVEAFVAALEFELTGDQRSALDTVLSDMATDVPMGRLLQGEVGSGKTIVAVSALLAAAASGMQGALLAPTEVLAEQHFLSLRSLLGATPAGGEQASLLDDDRNGARAADPVLEAHINGVDRPVRIALLIGSQTPRVKSRVHEMIAGGDVQVVVGTHAVIQEKVSFRDLAIAVVDEQHRFGVEQRAVLGAARPRPHLLGMSATPIPRSLALTVYGDLDLTTLRELPGGRKPITTTWAKTPRQGEEAYRHVRSEVAAGRQAFVVCPLINESEEIRTRSAVEEFAFLSSGPFSDLRLGLLHGRLPLAEKQRVMELFRRRELDVLVATPVIEVGIDIPNATVMLIEGAERFGLSQLHQLRGRIGRGEHPSRCVLLSDDPSAEARERLRIIERVSDGFELAEEDLRLRGPGDYIGTRQSGFADLKLATLMDADLLGLARAEATELVAADPGLTGPGHEALATEYDRVVGGRTAEFS